MRKIATAIPIVIIILAAAVGLLVAWCRGSTILTTSSPSRTYTVTIAGRKDKPIFPVDYTVRMSVSKAGKSFLSERRVHSGDWLDAPYASLYPNFSWVSDNVLHLYRKQYFEGHPSEVIVRNNLNEPVRFLRLNSYSMYFLFDLESGSETKVLIPPSRGDNTSIYVEGEFSEERKISGVGESFTTNKPSTYYVDITRNGLTITIENPEVSKDRSP